MRTNFCKCRDQFFKFLKRYDLKRMENRMNVQAEARAEDLVVTIGDRISTRADSLSDDATIFREKLWRALNEQAVLINSLHTQLEAVRGRLDAIDGTMRGGLRLTRSRTRRSGRNRDRNTRRTTRRNTQSEPEQE